MARIVNNKVAYGKSQALIDVFNEPLVGLRNPTGNDKGTIGQLWVNKLTNGVWMLTSFAGGLAVWTELDNIGGVGALTWSTEAGAAVAMAANHGYYLTNAGAVTCTLPVASALGNEIWIITDNSTAAGAGIIIAQNNPAQVVRYDQYTTTPGAGGSISFLGYGDGATPFQIELHLICTVANTAWSIVNWNRDHSAIV